jgi:hypothetical protein
MSGDTPKPKPVYPFDWPTGKPSRENRKPKKKWRRKAANPTGGGFCRAKKTGQGLEHPPGSSTTYST